MRKLLTILIVLLSTIGAFAGTCGNGYTYSRKFTVPAANVPNTDQTNFPVALAFNGASFFNNFYLPDLATVANSGKIQNTANNSISVSGPADLIFCDAASAGNSLKFEVAQYTATDGKAEMYVEIPTLSHTTATSFWMFYGNVSVVTSQQDLSLWTDASYVLVCHEPDGSSLNVKCSAGGTQTNHSATATAGVLGGSANFVGGSSQWIDTGGTYNVSTAATLEMWLNPPNASYSDIALMEGDVYGIRLGGDAPSLKPYMFACSNTACSATVGIVGPSNAVPQSSWTYFAGTFSPSTINTYINAVNNSARTYIVPPPASIGSGVNNIRIGSRTAGTNFFTGAIEEARLSSVTRSADWITDTYTNEYSPSTFSMMVGPTTTGPRIVQYSPCNSAQSAANPCPFSQNVVSGNTVLVVAANIVAGNCNIGSINSLFSDSRSTSFTYAILGDNNVGGQPNTCIAFGVLGSSGADTITAIANGSSSQSMVVYEIAGIASPSLDVTSVSTGAASGTLSTGSATATTSNSLLVCDFGGSSSGAQFYTASMSPSSMALLNTASASVLGATKGGTSAIQFTGSGSKSCTFTFGPGGSNNPTNTAGALAVIKYSPSGATKRRMAQVY